MIFIIMSAILLLLHVLLVRYLKPWQRRALAVNWILGIAAGLAGIVIGLIASHEPVGSVLRLLSAISFTITVWLSQNVDGNEQSSQDNQRIS